MNKKECAICRAKMGFFTRVKLQDGYICGECARKCTPSMLDVIGNQTVEIVKNNHGLREIKQQEVNNFTADVNINKNLQVNTVNRKFKLVSSGSSLAGGKMEEVFSADDLLDFEILTDEVPVYKNNGVGRAVVGGVMFGGVGALVGAATGKTKLKKTIVKEIKIKMTVRDMHNPTRVIYIHKGSELKVGGFLYNTFMSEAERLIGALENIMVS